MDLNCIEIYILKQWYHMCFYFHNENIRDVSLCRQTKRFCGLLFNGEVYRVYMK